jgi:FkbM family methyltransferase
MRIAIWTPFDHALGRLHRSLEARLKADGHTVDLYNWTFREQSALLRERFLTYDRVLGSSLITSSHLFDLSSVHIRSRMIAVAHIGVKNEHFHEKFMYVSASTPLAAVGAVSLDAVEFFANDITQPLLYLPCGIEPTEFRVRPPPSSIRRIGFVGNLSASASPQYRDVKRPEWIEEICRRTGCELVPIFGKPLSTDLYDNVDLVVCTSRVEGGPLGILEAAASGIPVISTRVGNVARLKHIKFFTTVDEACSLIADLNVNAELLAQYTAAVTAEVRRRFNWDRLYAKYWRPLFQGQGGSHLNFLEIGTSDFETCVQSASADVRGMSVEPVRLYLDQLPVKLGVTKVNQAVSDRNGTIDIYYVTPATIETFQLPSWCRGCNSVNKPHPHVLEQLRARVQLSGSEDEVDTYLRTFFAIDTVRVTDFDTLTREHNVRAIDYLKIDTEGHDVTIMKGVLAACLVRRELFPRKIKFETNEHSTPAEVDAIVSAFEAEGYTAERGYDTILRRQW